MSQSALKQHINKIQIILDIVKLSPYKFEIYCKVGLKLKKYRPFLFKFEIE